MRTQFTGDETLNVILSPLQETLSIELSPFLNLEHDTVTVDTVLEGITFHNVDGILVEGTMPNRGNTIGVISEKNEHYRIPQGYHAGEGLVYIDQTEADKLIEANIREGVEILGVDGGIPTERYVASEHIEGTYLNSLDYLKFESPAGIDQDTYLKVDGAKLGTGDVVEFDIFDVSTQAYLGTIKSSSNGPTALTFTVAKSGTYDVSLTAYSLNCNDVSKVVLNVNNVFDPDCQIVFSPSSGPQVKQLTCDGRHFDKDDVITVYVANESDQDSIYISNLVIRIKTRKEN